MDEPGIHVEVVHALAERYWSERLVLPASATVGDALARTTLAMTVPGLRIDPAMVALHGRLVRQDAALHDGDRIELLRPLACDPKEVRRRRAAESRDDAGAQRRPRRSFFSRGKLP